MFHPPVQLQEWPGEDHRSKIVFITRDIGESVIQPMFDQFVWGAEGAA
ncbi:GTP-binding protein [Azospirillum brasilense]